MDYTILTIFFATLGLAWYYLQWQKKKTVMKGLKEIPGPRGLPFIGNAHQLGNDMNTQFCKWSEEYGDIFQAKLGPYPWIVVSEPKLAKEIFTVDPLLAGRIVMSEFAMYEDDPNLGMFNSEGKKIIFEKSSPLWEVHRRFLLRHLRDFGFGKSSMEVMIMEEVDEVMEKYRKLAGTPVTEIRETMKLALVNSLWRILSSNRFAHDDPELLKLTNNTSKYMTKEMKDAIVFNESAENIGLAIFMPIVKRFMPELSGYNKLRRMFDENRNLFEKTIREHKENFDPDNLKDFIDVYLAEAKKADPSSTFYGEKGERQLAASLFDMFFAGSDSTAITISWSILYLCKFPQYQEKLQKEITHVTGNSRKVTVGDKSNMPFTMALIDEILRYSSLVPDGAQHKAMADTQFHGYFIPKGAVVQPNFMYINHCEKFFKDANTFKPERFLSPDGTKYVKDENLNPFQVGRRQCVGESLARDTVFLYLCNFFQNFTMKFDPTKDEPGFDAEPGFLKAPFPYTVIMSSNSN